MEMQSGKSVNASDINDAMEMQNKTQLMLDVMNGIYFCSYYIDLEHDCFSIMKSAPGEKYLELQEDKATDAICQFLSTMVSPADYKKMAAFMDFSTMQMRMENEQHLDCEYLSTTEKGWCRATLFPVDRDADNKLTHVLFVITSLDESKAQEAKQVTENRNSIEELYNNVPGGVVMFTWDGSDLKIIHASAFFENENEYIIKGMDEGKHGMNFDRVHPDDRKGYKEAVLDSLHTGNAMQYEFRLWNDSKNCYSWISIDARGSRREDGTLVIYALYSNISEQKEIELAAAKRQASLEAALEAADQICCEYDPHTHIIKCLTEDNFMKLPRVMYNYPDSIKEYNVIHPLDVKQFLKTAYLVDGSRLESCTIRCLKDGEYRWFNQRYSPYYDPQKERSIAILTMQDVTPQMEGMYEYQDRLRGLLAAREKVTNMCLLNITRDTCEGITLVDELKPLVAGANSIDEVVFGGAERIVGKNMQQDYYNLFCRENLLKQAAEGNMHIQMEYWLEREKNHYEWMISNVDMVQNPITEDIMGVAYNRSACERKLRESLFGTTLKNDYYFAVIVIKDTDEFYLYDVNSGVFGKREDDFWKVIYKDAENKCTPEIADFIQKKIYKESVLKKLETEAEYKFSYSSFYKGQQCRMEVRFSYADEDCSMLLVTMRNVTDNSLLEQFKHDSEHDALTGLYNRKTVFRKSRELLDTYPDERYAIVHVDLRHFRLYNTFFGEEAGDKLLCEVADMFSCMAPDYDHWVYGRIDADVFFACFPYEEKRYQKHVSRAVEQLKGYRKDFLVEAAVGIYFVTDRSMSIDAMFARATLAAKSLQSNELCTTVVYNQFMEQKLMEEQQIINDMQKAIDEEQFQVYLQPKYSLKTDKPVGAEALVRWMHPIRGMISPGEFIPVFEGNGFITTLDHYMWEHVCQLLKKWKDEGKPLFPISVNASRLSMYSETNFDYLKLLVKKYDIDPRYLELELTESAYMDEPAEMKKLLQMLRKAGFTILLDDFGSGYSSLNTLRELPVDILKLDMNFQSYDINDVRAEIVISSVVQMSKLLRLSVIAEGVETQEQADFLKKIDCEYVQGYLFARPMPAADYEQLLMDNEKGEV